jgi:hypothetical protein
MSPLSDALNRFIICIEEVDPEYIKSLMPGFESSVIENTFKILANAYQEYRILPDEIYELYTLTNGSHTREIENTYIYIDNIMTLNEAIQFVHDFYKTDIYKYKNQLVFPFARNDYEYTCVLAGQKESIVVHLDYEDPGGQEPIYDNITSMLRTTAINFESGAYFIQTQGEYKGKVDQDDDKVANILRNENPIIIETVIEELKHFASLSPEEIIDLISFENAGGIIRCAERYRDPKFIEPLRNLLTKRDQHSLMESITNRALSKIN